MKENELHSLLRKDWRESIKEGIGSSEKERKFRERIRDRVRFGLADIALLNQYARSEDIKQIFKKKEHKKPNLPEELLPSDELRETVWVFAMHAVALCWRGLRSNGMDKKEIFEKVVRDGIVWGEAEYEGVDRGAVEYDFSINTLEIHRHKEEYDPVEKWEKDLSLTGEDLKQLHDRLSEHPEVDSTAGEDIGDLIDECLVNDKQSGD